MEKEDGEDEEVSEGEVSYFFDTYAVVEIINENPAYEKYLQEPATITIFNLAEIYLIALRDLSEEKANIAYTQYKGAVVEIDDESLKEAMKFKKEKNKRDLSYTDCIGYFYAKRHGMKFLTGDEQFKDFEGVVFVK